MDRKIFSASLAALALTTAITGCSKPRNTDKELQKKYEDQGYTIGYGKDDWMAEDLKLYKFFQGKIVKKINKINDSGEVNYCFKIMLDDGQNFKKNVDESTYLQYDVGNRVNITLEMTIDKDTEKVVSGPSITTKYSKEKGNEER